MMHALVFVYHDDSLATFATLHLVAGANERGNEVADVLGFVKLNACAVIEQNGHDVGSFTSCIVLVQIVLACDADSIFHDFQAQD